MADTRFTDASGNQAGTLVQASWLNDVNTNTYTILSAVAGTNAVTGNGASTVTVGYPRGVAFRFIPQNTNTGAVTINISALGVKNVTKYGTTPLVAGDLVAGSWAFITYDGTQFQLLNPLSVPANVSALPGRLLNIQTFTASGTYTPTVGTTSIVVKGQGAGGAGGGCPATGVGNLSIGGGGGAGAVGETRLTSGFSGATVTIGTGGISVNGAAGGTGTSTSFGASLVLAGGVGGSAGPAAAQAVGQGGAGGVSTGGNVYNGSGGRGETSTAGTTTLVFMGGMGSNSLYGSGALPGIANNGSQSLGGAISGFGSGGGGAASGASQPSIGGSVGAGGILVVYEYT